MTPLSKDIIDALHADGYHVVTRQEWYATQLRISEMHNALDSLFHLLEDYQPTWYTEHHFKLASQALSSTAGEAAAKRMAALERLYRAFHDRTTCEAKFDEAGELGDGELQLAVLPYIDWHSDKAREALKELEAIDNG